MNERVRELAEQAGFCHDINQGIYLSAPIHIDTFAQLLIKECTDICAEQVTEYKKDIKSAWDQEEKDIYYEGMAAADRIRYKINRMFGVK